MSSKQMSPDLLQRIRQGLDAEFGFKREANGWLRGGKCPTCGGKELFTRADNPWVIKCPRENKCKPQFIAHAKELFPDLFSDYSKRARELEKSIPAEKRSPTAIIDLYLCDGRGFDLETLKTWNEQQKEIDVRNRRAPVDFYTQETYYDPAINEGTATVRFPFSNGYWERLIDRPERFGGKKARFKPGMTVSGLWWCPPTLQPSTVYELWLVEGVFDAIALMLNGIAAVALMSCNNYPEKALEQLRITLAQNGKEAIKLVWALDGDAAGQKYTRRWIRQARKEGWICEAAHIPATHAGKRDWNDLHQLEKLSPEDIEEYKYHGAVLTAKDEVEKATLLYLHNRIGNEFHFDFNQCLYWFKLDLEAFEKLREKLAEKHPDDDEKEIRRKAIIESHPVQRIAKCNPEALYFQCNTITGESWYYYQVEFPHENAQPIKNTFTAAQLSSAGEFKKRLLHIAPGAVFKGTNMMLDRMIENQLDNIKRVETIDFIGYTREHQSYVFSDVAVKDGLLIEINNEDFFQMNAKKFLKSLNQSVALTINKDKADYNVRWPRILWNAFGVKGYVALAFWFGTLFAEQIRAKQKSLPFLEVVGEAGAGKSTLIEFLWKLVGRLDYEGFDPSKSTLAARSRNFAQVANLPVVLIESDRERLGSEKSLHVRSFDWDELKTAYNGRSVRARGMATSGNETYEPPFRGAIVISQNNPVMASDAVLQRICHLFFDRSTQTAETKEAATMLERMPIEAVSHFVLLAVKTESRTMEIMESRCSVYEGQINATGKVRNERLKKNHAQLMAMAEALAPIIGMNEQQLDMVHDYIKFMAAERQDAINADTEVVQQFWDTYEFLNDPSSNFKALNHSNTPGETIAINLNQFYQVAQECKQPMPDVALLKKALKGSRRNKFVDYRNVTSKLSNIPKSVRCYIFENNTKKG